MTDKDYAKLKQIEEAIQSFNSKDLYESSLRFFKALDYQSNKIIKLNPGNYEGFIDSFNLSKNSINKEKALVSHWKKIEFIFQVADSEITRIQSLFDTGEVDSNEYQSFLFFTIQLKEETYKRSDLVKITRELNLPFKMPVILLFNYGNKLTLSIIDRRLHKRDTSKDVLEKVTLIKDIDITNPQRAHKEILKDLSLSELYKKFEFHSFVKLHEAWKETLNISELNKKFYKELAYWYFWALQEVKFPDDELKDDKTRNPVNVIRLITRLIFVWFLKEKNLIPDDLFNKRELDKILDYKDKTGSTYYKAILQNLFFATLNTEMNKDVKDKNKISRTFVNRNTGVPHYFRYSRFIKDQHKFASWMDNIPFLNGGLFECLDKRTKDKDIFIDGFTQQVKKEEMVKVPDYLFFSNAPKEIDLNNTFHTKGKKYEVRGLIDILSRYKFTIEENTPVEEEVALDPELLGKVFENLLASYNEETETTARKLTGSFYTPREIVNYMVDESLITYLCNCLLKEDDENKREELNERLHHLFSYTAEEPQFADAEIKELIDAIDNCKILDPACGSGAFPMGILHKLVFILGKLDPNNKRWKQKQQDKAKRDKKLAEKMEDEKNRKGAKKEIDKRIDDIEKAFNQNNHELDFARKLYLIENCIYGVDKQPVAIQISKLRFFIALIVDQKTENDTEPNRGIRPLPNLETKFVAADTLVSIEKPVQLTIMNQDEALQKAIKDKESEIHRIREKHFRARTPETKEKYRSLDAQHRDELALLLEKDGFPKDATKKLAGWNPYDQNKFADFFDPMWMFEVDKGFDIVIGNPPYVSISKIEDKTILKKQGYLTFENTGDLYSLFYERSNQLLKQKGTTNFITSRQWINAGYGKSTRKYFAEKTNPLQLIDFGRVKIFESATVFVNVLMFEKNKNKQQLKACKLDDNYTIEGNDLGSYFEDNFVMLNNLNETVWKIGEDNVEHINSIIEQQGVKLKDWKGIGFYAGIKTSYNEAFHIDEELKEALIKKDKRNGKIIKPLLRGKDIKRYGYDYKNIYLINTHNGIKDNGEKPINCKKDYPEIYKHLLQYKTELENREDKGVHWSNLRNCAFLNEFENEKIVWIEISDKANYTYDTNGMYLTNSAYFMSGKSLKYILAVLNSKLSDFYFFQITAKIAGGRKRYTKQYVEQIPVKQIPDNEQLSFNILVDFVLVLKKENHDSSLFENVINGCVYELYFGEEMKKAGVDILAFVEKDLEAVKKTKPGDRYSPIV